MRALLLLFLSMAVFNSYAIEPDNELPQYKQGIVRNFDAAGEGCEWLIEVDGNLFRPKNLHETYKVDGMAVKLDFDYSVSVFECPEMSSPVQEIIISYIEKAPLEKPDPYRQSPEK